MNWKLLTESERETGVESNDNPLVSGSARSFKIPVKENMQAKIENVCFCV